MCLSRLIGTYFLTQYKTPPPHMHAVTCNPVCLSMGSFTQIPPQGCVMSSYRNWRCHSLTELYWGASKPSSQLGLTL